MASDQPLMASVDLWAANFAPKGWAFCQGQTLSIQAYTALFSLLGTTYGGNGISTFQLPDLRGRVPVGAGQGLGLSSYVLGEMSGQESVTLRVENLPAHTHAAKGTVEPNANSGGRGISLTNNVVGNFPATTSGTDIYASSSNAKMGSTDLSITVGMTGGNLPVSILQPFLILNYIIALTGIFPSRN